MKEGLALASDRAFFYRRLHSLLGVIPVGAFLVEHLITNYFATRGEEAFTEKVLWINNLPFLILLEVFFIFLPILFHGVYGLYIAYQAKPNLGSFGTFRNAMFVLQRVTGVITLIFIAWHVWETRLQVALGNVAKEELYDLMVAILSNNWMFAFYLVGVIAAVFHFANGLWSFLVSWGITVGPRAQRISTYVTMAIFVFVSYIGVAALLAFRNAAMALGS